jgi:DNA-binding NarL/FixJ family response regulator
MSQATVLVAEDHTIVADGLRALLKDSFDLVGVVQDGRQLLESAKRLKPDIIITDISMPLLNGLDVVRQLRHDGIRSRIVVLTMHTDPEYAEEAFQAGVSGYVVKHAAAEELLTALNDVIAGRIYLTPLVSKDVLSVLIASKNKSGEKEKDTKLTPRQRDILQMIVDGKTMNEPAAILNISTRTAESYKYEMMEQLGIKTVAELIQYAIRSRVVAP